MAKCKQASRIGAFPWKGRAACVLAAWILTGCFGGKEVPTTSSTELVDDFTCGVVNEVSTGDPLAACSWHLDNRAQSAFSGNGGISGMDLNLLDTETAGIDGTGVRVAVSDTGLEIRHEDLAGNVIAGASKNYDASASDPTDPTNVKTSQGDHGTSVAGIIAAVKGNGKGGRGVAPGAGLAGLNWLNYQSTASKLDQADGDFDIFNQSWGLGTTVSAVIDSVYRDQLEHGVTTLRSGKGAVYVKAAGNFFGTGINCNADPNNTTPYTINVAAMNATGIAASYSSACSALWITAPGGEFGTTSPAIITTDQSGCSSGYARTGSPLNTFDSGGPGNVDCEYTATFNGTSSAAPMVSGVAALLLDANPALTWRDVKHILATTARQIDASIPAISRNLFGLGDPPSGHVWEDPWITNGAGFKFHNWYGFGLADTDAAVTMASGYVSGLGSWVDLRLSDGSWNYGTGAMALSIPDASAGGATSQIVIAEDIVIEAVQVRVNVSHLSSGDIGLELTSPAGTKSILLNVNHGFGDSDDLAAMVLLSNAFYGESSAGTWTLKAIDGKTGTTGTLTGWEINVSGHSSTFTGF